MRALEPFHALAVADFAAFLVRAKQYQASGSVRVPDAGEQQAEKLLKLVAQLSDAAKHPAQGGLAGIQHEVAKAMQALAANAGLKGKLAPDPKWAGAQVARARVEPHLKMIYDLAARIISPDVYHDPPIHEAIARLEGLDRESLTAIATEFGIKTSARSKPAKIIGDVLVKLSGHKPAKAKKAKAPAASVDPAIVEENARRLAALVEHSADPHAVPDSEVEAELNRLKSLGKPTLFEVANQAGIEGVRSGDPVSAILERVRLRLTAARRAGSGPKCERRKSGNIPPGAASCSHPQWETDMNQARHSLDVLEIPNPCRVPWKSMKGNERVRFCAQCRKSVYNISAMTLAEADAILTNQTDGPCVRFFRRMDGTVITTDHCGNWVTRSWRRFAIGVSAMFVAILSLTGCDCAKLGFCDQGKIAPPSKSERPPIAKKGSTTTTKPTKDQE